MRFMVRASLACVPALSQMKVGDQPRRAIARASVFHSHFSHIQFTPGGGTFLPRRG